MKAHTKAGHILPCLHGISTKYRKLYCYPSQKKIIELVERKQKVKISIATLNRWLRVIEDEGLIKRKRRIRRDKKLGMVFQSTLYTITRTGYEQLQNLGLNVWKILKLFFGKDRGEKKKVETAVKKNGNGVELITYQEHVKRLEKTRLSNI